METLCPKDGRKQASGDSRPGVRALPGLWPGPGQEAAVTCYSWCGSVAAVQETPMPGGAALF